MHRFRAAEDEAAGKYRELENGAVHGDVHVPRKNRPAHEDMHWIPEG